MIATVRPRALLLVTSAACLSLACWTHPQVVWSPDGRQAAVIAVDGLRVMDVEGSLAPPLAAGVSQAVWFADSQRLALVKHSEVPDLPALTASLGPERTETLARSAELLWQQLPVLVSNEQLAQLPRSLAVFQPSPDSAYVLVGGDHADVWLIGVPDGDVKRYDTGYSYNDDISMPSWRQPGEFVYLRKAASGTEVVLRRGETERVLSAEWPAGVLNLVPDGSRRIW